MQKLNTYEKQQLVSTIREIESKTSAECVTVISKQSDDYLAFPYLWAALLALASPFLLLILPDTILPTMNRWFFTWSDPSSHPIPYDILFIQFIVFIVLSSLFQISCIKLKLVPKTIQHRRAKRHAHELFFIEGLHLTEERTGIMFFVSEAERYVEVIADHAINEKVINEDSKYWQHVVNVFVENIKAGKLYEGYEDAIQACGKVLIKHFPASARDTNQLPDHLIEIN